MVFPFDYSYCVVVSVAHSFLLFIGEEYCFCYFSTFFSCSPNQVDVRQINRRDKKKGSLNGNVGECPGHSKTLGEAKQLRLMCDFRP